MKLSHAKAESQDSASSKKKFSKNPNVDTSFLPDRQREEQERVEREELRKEWLAQQERTKLEDVEITYSYWDGSGHRKTVEVRSQSWRSLQPDHLTRPQCKKGDDIAAFLSKCRAQFPELRGTSVDNLMYIKASFVLKTTERFSLRSLGGLDYSTCSFA